LIRARELTTKAISPLERQSDKRELAAGYEAAAALREALLGNATRAQGYVSQALRDSKGRDVQYATGLALAFLASRNTDVLRVEDLCNNLGNQFPKDTLVQRYFLPTIRAKLRLSQGKAVEAIELLQSTAPYDLAAPGVTSFSPNLYSIYVRGEAYLAARKTAEALAEFQKVLDHRGLAFNSTVVVLSKLGIARAHALHGDKTAARGAYDAFRDSWRTADSDIPVFRLALVERARLK